MSGVFTGFAVVILCIVTGYVLGRTGVLGPHAREVLSKLIFFVLSPFLLFTVLSSADVAALFSTLLPVTALSAVGVMVIFTVISRFLWRRSTGDVVIGALSAGYTNAGNIGIPIAFYLLGDAAYAAPVTLVQLLVFMPVALALLDAERSGSRDIGRILRQTVKNPMLIGAGAGVVVSLAGWDLPGVVAQPISVIGDACVPIMLISYGISLHGQKVLTTLGRRRDVIVASVLNLFVMPAIAFALGTWVFDLSPADVYVVTVLALLPTAQNVFNYAQRYGRGEIIARDTIFVTTLCALPLMLILSLVHHSFAG